MDILKKLNITEETYNSIARDENGKLTPVPKRGRSKESIADGINIFRRAMMDNIQKDSFSLQESYRIGKVFFNNKCYLCLKDLEQEQADHIISHKKGGYSAAGNILPACRKCNSEKGDNYYKDTKFYNKATHEKIKQFQDAFDFKVLPEETFDLIDSLVQIKLEEIKEYIKKIVIT